jgi:hypothetical protein
MKFMKHLKGGQAIKVLGPVLLKRRGPRLAQALYAGTWFSSTVLPNLNEEALALFSDVVIVFPGCWLAFRLKPTFLLCNGCTVFSLFFKYKYR